MWPNIIKSSYSLNSCCWLKFVQMDVIGVLGFFQHILGPINFFVCTIPSCMCACLYHAGFCVVGFHSLYGCIIKLLAFILQTTR